MLWYTIEYVTKQAFRYGVESDIWLDVIYTYNKLFISCRNCHY